MSNVNIWIKLKLPEFVDVIIVPVVVIHIDAFFATFV